MIIKDDWQRYLIRPLSFSFPRSPFHRGDQHDNISLMPRTLASYELHHPRSPGSKLASSAMSRSGKGKSVDRSAQQSSHEDDYSDNDEYDDDDDDNNDDDWKRIEDPGERRRIQNRLAQRKFRKSQCSASLPLSIMVLHQRPTILFNALYGITVLDYGR
jgi:hypothetical protein